jgi:demethoxyubiquinone hydroxylase (CLK1/Coq7/Cat5 family)
MSATEVISEIKKLPPPQRRQVFQYVDDELRHAEDAADNVAAERALAEPGENIPWSAAKKNLGWA